MSDSIIDPEITTAEITDAVPTTTEITDAIIADTDTNKIDSLATLGLLGPISNSLAYRVHEIEKHVHSREYVYGISASQAGNDWALENTLNHYTAISGVGTWGADANDEAKVWGTDDVGHGSNVKMDLHRVFVKALSVDTPFLVRIVYGTGTMPDAITAGQMSTFIVQNNPAGNKAGGSPISIQMPRITMGTTKMWVQIACATNNATMQFFILAHEYAG